MKVERIVESSEWEAVVLEAGGPAPCPPKRSLAERSLLSGQDALAVERLFKTLANATRIRLLHALARAGEMRVGELAEAVGMSVQAVSNQLQRLELSGIVAARREGTAMHYRIEDACVIEMLQRGICLMEETETRMGHARV